MAQPELAWDELGITGEKREAKRQELSDRYRRHIEAGELYYPYVSYAYFEWYSDNGRVVLELDPSQVETVETALANAKTAAELHADEKQRREAFGSFMGGMLKSISEENREKGGDGNVTGIVAG